MQNGKGSSQRPRQVSKEQFDSNWDQIFKKQKEKEKHTELNSKSSSVYNTNNSTGVR
jgi:hypothetical protein